MFETLTRGILKIGRAADKPAAPPSRSAHYWDYENEILYGVNNQLLWTPISPAPPRLYATSFNQGTSSPVTLIAAPPVGGYILSVGVRVDDSAAAGAPTLAIGVSGDTGRYMTTAQNDLTTIGAYTVSPLNALGGTPPAIIATIVADGQEFAGEIIIMIGRE